MAIEKQIINEVGQGFSYIKIESVVFDFGFNPYVKVYLKCYTNETYRSIEKEELADTLSKIDRYYVLVEKSEKTQEEWLEFNTLNIQELEAFKITEKHIKMMECGIKYANDIRPSIYTLLETLDEFKGCTFI